MSDYFVFAGCLRSELSFPELTESHGRPPDWTLRFGTLSRAENAEVLCDADLTDTCRVRLTRGDGWLRYSHSCAGTFEVFAQGRRILFEPAPGGDLNVARTDFVARVLLHCVDRGKVSWLHGSAVRIADRGLAFLGASGSGKSTLAVALAGSGATHICDDTLPIDMGQPPAIWPSDHIVRLCADTKGRLASRSCAVRRESDGKFVLTRGAVSPAIFRDGAQQAPAGRTPLAAVYLLNPPVPPDDSRPAMAVTRTRIAPTAAITRLMQHLKLGLVVSPDDPARIVRQLAAIASAVPVYELQVCRDWNRIDEVVSEINGWHGGDSAAGVLSPLVAIPA